MSNRVALITGSSRGIGRAIALALAQEGCQIAVNYYESSQVEDEVNAAHRRDAEEVAREIEALGSKAVVLGADVSCSQSAQQLVEQTVKALGQIDILVNNAGINKDNLVLRISDEEWDQVLKTNLYGAFYCSRAAVKHMVRRRYGRIVSISSVVGVSGNAGQVHYAASKSGLLGFTYSLAKEYGRRGITANVVAPGYIQSDMTAQLSDAQTAHIADRIVLGRLGTPEDVAGVVAFLVSPRADYITGQLIRVDGGLGGL
ncbi:MAG: 3-oxoacyl-[acyl-carrier-protein] reductase [Syntrophomonadaceae bacterium]|jgi:3-oxoacyl-[acyl-carrier protein] reductase|nr:3-oxoacyl-[acyl-carrier-protein] reductase [Syntrophomonadaceae bacterium]